MTPQRTCARPVFLSFVPPLSPLARLGRHAALGGALAAALLCPRPAAAQDYAAPDYYVSADPTPYFATTALTVTFSASDLSDAPAPGTTVAFFMALASDPSQTWDLGQAEVPAIDPWQYVTQTVTFPLPADAPTGTTDMQLIANINPGGDNGEVQTDNNIAMAGFELDAADASVPADTSTTPAVQSDPPTPSDTTDPPTPSPSPAPSADTWSRTML